MKRVKRLLAFLLAFTLVFGSLQSGVLTVAAEENEQTMEADAGDQPEGETPANEENQEEPAEAAADEATSDEQAEVTEAAKDDPETTNELEEVQSDESEEVAEEVEASEDDSQVEEEEALEENAEETEEESDEPLVFEVTQDGVTVRISGTADALAGVASVSVSKLSDEKIEVYEEAFAEDDTITASKVIAAYDITLLNEDGEAIEPDGSVSVTITSDVLQEYLEEGEDIQVLHDTNTTVEAIEDDSIDNETVSTDALEVLDIESDDSGSIAVTMDSFSTVLFALQVSANNGTGEYTLTLADYAKSEFYDADVISSIAITEIGGETVTAGLKSYAANQGDEIVVTVTYKNGVTNAMAAVERSYTTASGATSKYVMPVTANEDGAACKTYGVEMPAGDTTISLVGLTYWEVTNTTLAITGSGKMPSFIASDETVYSPYHATYRDQVTTVTIGEGITRKGNYTCAWFTNLTELSLP
ncbi:MAG: hypothetical protein LUC60_06290, partial [Lachnospiraceae bacterium]|nr:hypothetical protein [Lachnospiraceae bacterium]